MKINNLALMFAFSLVASVCAPQLRADEPNVESLTVQTSISFSDVAGSISSQLKDGIMLYLQRLPIKIAVVILTHTIASRQSQESLNQDVYRRFIENITPRQALKATFLLPLLEELCFTILPHELQESKYRYVQHILFGLAHKHENKSMWLVHGLSAGISNFLGHRYLQKKPGNYIAPIVGHILNNGIAFGLFFGLKKLAE